MSTTLAAPAFERPDASIRPPERVPAEPLLENADPVTPPVHAVEIPRVIIESNVEQPAATDSAEPDEPAKIYKHVLPDGREVSGTREQAAKLCPVIGKMSTENATATLNEADLAQRVAARGREKRLAREQAKREQDNQADKEPTITTAAQSQSTTARRAALPAEVAASARSRVAARQAEANRAATTAAARPAETPRPLTSRVKPALRTEQVQAQAEAARAALAREQQARQDSAKKLQLQLPEAVKPLVTPTGQRKQERRQPPKPTAHRQPPEHKTNKPVTRRPSEVVKIAKKPASKPAITQSAAPAGPEKSSRLPNVTEQTSAAPAKSRRARAVSAAEQPSAAPTVLASVPTAAKLIARLADSQADEPPSESWPEVPTTESQGLALPSLEAEARDFAAAIGAVPEMPERTAAGDWVDELWQRLTAEAEAETETGLEPDSLTREGTLATETPEAVILSDQALQQAETLLEALPDSVQERLAHYVRTGEPAAVAATETLVADIALAADRLHVLSVTDRGGSEEAEQIETLLGTWYGELLTRLELETDAADITDFIALVRSPAYQQTPETAVGEPVDELRERQRTDRRLGRSLPGKLLSYFSHHLRHEVARLMVQRSIYSCPSPVVYL